MRTPQNEDLTLEEREQHVPERTCILTRRKGTREELIRLFEHLEGELETSGFLFPPGNRPGMIRNLRSILHRAQLTDQEVRTLRG